MSVKLVDIEITEPLRNITDVDGFEGTWALIRQNAVPIGRLYLEAHNNCISSERLAVDISNWFGFDLARNAIYQRLAEILNFPFISVVICTKDRPHSLKSTLYSMLFLDYPHYEVIVVDNAPSGPETAELVSLYPFRYVLESNVGLDRARNRGIAESSGEIIAYIDDDALADPGWLKGIASGFSDENTMAVTGLVYPAEMRTRAQELFEVAYGGFGRGYIRQTFRKGRIHKRQFFSPSIGTGCNMAFRKSVFDEVGMFDVAFDMGTPTGGAGDLDMFHRILNAEMVIAYRPDALVRHSHRESMEELQKQLSNFGKSFFALQTKNFIREPENRLEICNFVVKWIFIWHLRRMALRIMRREQMPLKLILAEFAGCFRGSKAYFQSTRLAKERERKMRDAIQSSEVC